MKPYRPALRKRTVTVAIAFAVVSVAVAYVIQPRGRTDAATPAAVAITTRTSDTTGAQCVKVDPVHPRLIPTPGFDPLTAPDAELHAHDFPSRPTAPAQLSVWEGYAKKYLAGEVINCATPGPGDIPPQYRTLAHTYSLPPQPWLSSDGPRRRLASLRSADRHQ
jgi:hypothetical protein